MRDPEGMEARRVLKNGGLLVDTRPISVDVPLLILTTEGWKSAGKPDQSPDRVDDLAAHRAIRVVVQEGLFTRVSQDYFNVGNYWDSLKELREAADGPWNGDMIFSEEIWRQARTLFKRGKGKRRVLLPFRKKISVYLKI
jgi:hypothetical protein